MNRRRLTLIEVLQPRAFGATPERARVTRTILQPEIDAFEQMEAQSATDRASEKPSLPSRQKRTAAPQTQPAL